MDTEDQVGLPATLYHYTSFEAFLNIVKSKTIWVTESSYLNDSTEFGYGLELAEEIYRGRSTNSEAATWFFENADRTLHTYIFSLSRQGDLLSQWRAYCPDGGVSIGFSTKTLTRIAAQHNFALVRCIYDPELQRAKIIRMLEEQLNEDEFYSVFPRLIASLKHPSFSEEAEFRLVSRSRIVEQRIYKARWRATKTTPVEYTEVKLRSIESEDIRRLHRDRKLSEEDLADLTMFAFENEYESGLEPFRDIIVGPTARQELVQKAVSDFISENTSYGRSERNPGGLIKVSSSKIPYRAK